VRLLLTGASGFIGQHLTEEFADYEIFAASEDNMDLRNPSQVDDVVARVQPDIVLHLAARTEVAWSFDAYYDVSNVNYLGTVALAEANRRFNPNLRLFVLASTMETYGHQTIRKPFTETTAQHPAAPYAVAKVAAEKYLAYMDYAYGFPYTILRQTNTYGRHDNDFFVVERIITQMLRGDVCRLGDPAPYRNFLHIDDLVALYRAVVDQKPLGETFVTGPNNALTIEDLAEKIRRIVGWTGTVEWHTQPKRPGEIYYLNSSALKAYEQLGWRPEVGLDEGLARTVELWR
jgi:nucleoside-diphosphate-sugar epimerase